MSILLVFLLSVTSWAGAECRSNYGAALQALSRQATDPELRSVAGQCLVKYHLDKTEVAKEILRVLKNPEEDLFLREDLIDAFAHGTLRKKVQVKEALSPELNDQDREAVGRTVASAQDILAVTQAVKSMNETVSTVAMENEFFKVLGEIALNSTNHIILRSMAISALEEASKKIVASGLYEDRSLRITQDTLRALATSGENIDYYSGAHSAYERLVIAGMPFFKEPLGRALASEPTRK